MQRKKGLRRTEWKRKAKPANRKAAMGTKRPRKPIDRVSKKTAKRKRKNKANNHCREMHRKYKHTPCWWCRKKPGCHVHHIAHKPRHDMVDHRTGLFWCCLDCHLPKLHGKVTILECFERRREYPGWDDEIAKSLYHARMGQVDWLPPLGLGGAA